MKAFVALCSGFFFLLGVLALLALTRYRGFNILGTDESGESMPRGLNHDGRSLYYRGVCTAAVAAAMDAAGPCSEALVEPRGRLGPLRLLVDSEGNRVRIWYEDGCQAFSRRRIWHDAAGDRVLQEIGDDATTRYYLYDKEDRLERTLTVPPGPGGEPNEGLLSPEEAWTLVSLGHAGGARDAGGEPRPTSDPDPGGASHEPDRARGHSSEYTLEGRLKTPCSRVWERASPPHGDR